MLQYQTGQFIAATETNINERVKYTANTSMVLLDTANTNTDGSGTLGTIITGASNGTLVQTLTIKGMMSTTRGQVRIFLYDGSAITALIDEIQIPAVTQSSKTETFQISYDVGISLKNGYSLKGATVTGDDFIVVAEGLDYIYP